MDGFRTATLGLPMDPALQTYTFRPDRRSWRQAWLVPITALLIFGAFFAFAVPDDFPGRLLLFPLVALFLMLSLLSGAMFLRRRLHRLEIRSFPDGSFSTVEKLLRQRTALPPPETTVKHVKTPDSRPFLRTSGDFAFGEILSDEQREEIVVLINSGKDPQVRIGNMRMH